MGVAMWAGLRQVEALRESVAFALEDGAIQRYKKLDLEELVNWLTEQGIEPVIFHNTVTGEESVNLLWSMRKFLKERYPEKSFNSIRDEMRWSKYCEPDFGVHRSGVGWDSLPNFVITSAFVRLLGASEQFELDVLKSLLYYRPSGIMTPPDNFSTTTVDSEVLTEIPEKQDVYSKPPLWGWIKKSAENNVERKKILKRVYDIETIPENFNNLNKTDTNKYRDELYEKRNAIAHGRNRVEMTLGYYCTAELFVVETIRTVAQQCLDKLKIIL